MIEAFQFLSVNDDHESHPGWCEGLLLKISSGASPGRDPISVPADRTLKQTRTVIYRTGCFGIISLY